MIPQLLSPTLMSTPTATRQPLPATAQGSDPLDQLHDAPYSSFTPELRLARGPLMDVLKALETPDTLFVTDAYNYPRLRYMGNVEKVTSGSVDQVLKILHRPGYNQFKHVVGVGGCLALDIAKAVATDKDLVVAPTLLSTNCITKNRAVIGEGLHVKSVRTTTPREVVVSVDDLLAQDKPTLTHWSQAGWGDFFAKLSAMIDHAWEKGETATFDSMRKEDSDVVEGLEWLDKSFNGYDRESMEKLAHYVHTAGVKVIEAGTNDCSVGGEHKFYKAMMDLYPYLREIPPHGTVVSVGTLIAMKAHAEATGHSEMYDSLRSVFAKLELPLTQDALDRMGMTREVLEKSLARIGEADVKPSFLGAAFKSGDFSVLDRVFGPAKPAEEWRLCA